MQIPAPEEKIVCPHCGVTFRAGWDQNLLAHDAEGRWWIRHTICADCERLIAYLYQAADRSLRTLADRTDGALAALADALHPPPADVQSVRMIRPRTANRKPIPDKVPKTIAEDYAEAANVLPESAKASAALSRRCLQNLLVEKAGVTRHDLNDQIQEVLDANILPADLAEDLDTVRLIGNFGTHPIKSKNTGEIVPVEPGEAEWNLDVLDDLFDFFYARPERRSEKRTAFDAKLKAAGRQPLAEIRKKKRE